MRAKLSRSAWQAVYTAEPTLARVLDPECIGAVGRVESPSANVTRLVGRPSTCEAIWVIAVYVPGPMSAVALATRAVPSALMLAIAVAEVRLLEWAGRRHTHADQQVALPLGTRCRLAS